MGVLPGGTDLLKDNLSNLLRGHAGADFHLRAVVLLSLLIISNYSSIICLFFSWQFTKIHAGADFHL